MTSNEEGKEKQKSHKLRNIGIIVGGVVGVLIILSLIPVNTLGPPKYNVLSVNVEHTSGYIFNVNYVVSGRVVNNGGSASSPIPLALKVMDESGNILYQTTTYSQPSILKAGEEGTYSKQISTDDLGGYRQGFKVYVQQAE